MPRIDAVAVIATDMERTVSFYRCLGFDFDGVDLTADHVEPNQAPGETRLMIDSAALALKLNGQGAAPGGHPAFAILCDSPDHVDSLAAGVTAAGFDVVTPPWDAFWGQRYATVRDPDGHKIDLFAPLPTA